MVGKGRWQRAKTRITTADSQGRVVDLHGLRTTLGTNLARAGVVPQVAQRIMRHSDYKTTLAHYTVLGLTDTAKAISQLPDIHRESQAVAVAVGAENFMPSRAQLPHQQLERETMRNGALSCVGADDRGDVAFVQKPLTSAGICDNVRHGAMSHKDSCGRNSVVECQLPKLDVGSSNLLARCRCNDLSERRLGVPASVWQCGCEARRKW
jgi:hypothetical protein